MSLRWNRSALANAAFVVAAIYLSFWNFCLHQIWDFSFWVLEGMIIAAFLRKSTPWKCIVLTYASFVLLRASTPPINNLVGKDLRILPLGGKLGVASDYRPLLTLG